MHVQHRSYNESDYQKRKYLDIVGLKLRSILRKAKRVDDSVLVLRLVSL